MARADRKTKLAEAHDHVVGDGGGFITALKARVMRTELLRQDMHGL